MTCGLFEDVTDAPTLFANGGGASPFVALLSMADEMGGEHWRRVSDVAQVVANFLRCHPSVEAVRYPGLKGDALFEEAAHTLVGGFGPVVEFAAGGRWWRLTCEDVDAREACLELEGWLRA